MIGLVILLLFVFIYWTSAFNGKFKEFFIYLFIVCNILFQLGWGSFYLMKKNTNGEQKEYTSVRTLLCRVVHFFNVCVCFSKYLLHSQDKDYTKLPIIEVWIGIVSTGCWIAYSFIQKTNVLPLQILIPNSVYFVILIALVICYCVLRFCGKEQTL